MGRKRNVVRFGTAGPVELSGYKDVLLKGH